ncbi:hypothetical protein [Rhizobium grahamii]|uniref:Uncharacterized protein n=2 Tax=Rhizobium grahamii TaxID=1120045 RepID=S3HN58_9HYPH|nr:hypothetical protein [Rhizobium grahamii]EPE94851.1 hypothetical protein RGCCGE502_30133 [Rhizobium grahamii CCGE 502]RDJ05636.1 hypothetical protein B5K06_24595 [Rhizobium grahamii]
MSKQLSSIQSAALSAEQTSSILLGFAETLSAFAQQLPGDDRDLRTILHDVSASIKAMVNDIAHGDSDVALEIIQSAARLVSVMRQVMLRRSLSPTLH